MKWASTHALVAGIGLIALTNAVALVGVLYNRSGEPSATLQLTQRELTPSYAWRYDEENSGASLVLFWRLYEERAYQPQYYRSYGGSPTWFDKAKLEALGFYTSVVPYDSKSEARFEKQLPREVLLVLELDGPTYRRVVELAKRRADSEEAKAFASPGDRGARESAKNAREVLEREEKRNSRLFVVDAGLDAAALRAKYPDTGRYAVVWGQVRPASYSSSRNEITGIVTGLSSSVLNVPLGMREVLGSKRIEHSEEPKRPPFDATVAFGKRFEPWILSAAKR